MTTTSQADRIARRLVVPALVVFLVFGAMTLSRGTATRGDTAVGIRILELEFAGFTGGPEPLLAEITTALVDASDVDVAEARVEVERAIHASLWWDFGFILGYSVLLFCLARIVRSSFRSPQWRRAGGFIGWAALAAGGFDLIENIALFRVVADPAAEGWALLAAAAAGLKWSIVAVATGYVAIGFAKWLRSRLGGSAQ